MFPKIKMSIFNTILKYRKSQSTTLIKAYMVLKKYFLKGKIKLYGICKGWKEGSRLRTQRS